MTIEEIKSMLEKTRMMQGCVYNKYNLDIFSNN